MPSPRPEWTLSFLEEKRKHSDPYADPIAAQIIEQHKQGELKDFYQVFVLPHHVDYEALSPFLREYFETTAQLPKWADRAKIKRGEEVFRLHGLMAGMLLQAKSLPECYACWRGAKVLFNTGRMTGVDHLIRLTRRLMETAQFVINVMAEDGLEPEGVGIVAAQKVRLIHAAIRYYIRENEWDAEKYGEPINQEDMAGTLMSFSALILEGFEMLGIELSIEDKDAYIHSWAVVGHIMGLHDDLIPHNYEEAMWLGRTILDQQKGHSMEGVALTEAILLFMEEHVPLKWLLGSFPRSMVRFLIGREMADYLEIKPPNRLVTWLTDLFLPRAFASKHRLHPSRIWALLLERFKMRLQQGMILKYNDYKKVHFYIPPSLREDWGL